MEISEGQTLKSRYRIEKFLGRGGMAEVYRVFDQLRGVHLAMKVLREDLAEDRVFMRRFEREANNLTKLQHPNIVRCYGLETEGRTAFMLMDYIEGSTLRGEIFDAKGPMSMERTREILTPVCSALNYAHQMGMVHCDVKSANIMIHKNGTVYVTDFGIARGMDNATSTMVGIGTPAYMAPELIRGEDPTPQTDIYALGIVLYEMLTGGERPFTGERAEITGTTAEKVRWEHLKLEPITISQFNPYLSEEIDNLIFSCLAKVSSERPLSANLISAIFLGSQPSINEKVKLPSSTNLSINHSSKKNERMPIEKDDKDRKKVANHLTPVEKKRNHSKVNLNTDMVLIPSGKFVMGSNLNSDEKPEHHVFIDSFWIDRTPVTNALFTDFLNSRKIQIDETVDWIDPFSKEIKIFFQGGKWYVRDGYQDHPMVMVNWFGADAYCQWAGKRLPTEAEWEKAARGKDSRIYPWGDQIPNLCILNCGNTYLETTSVDKFPDGASPFGVLDMLGNVWEWVADWFDKTTYKNSDTNPIGPVTGIFRVLRGGCWDVDYKNIRVTSRGRHFPNVCSKYHGFRCVKDAD